MPPKVTKKSEKKFERTVLLINNKLEIIKKMKWGISQSWLIFKYNIWLCTPYNIWIHTYSHITVKAPVLIRSPKLSSEEPVQYLDGLITVLQALDYTNSSFWWNGESVVTGLESLWLSLHFIFFIFFYHILTDIQNAAKGDEQILHFNPIVLYNQLYV